MSTVREHTYIICAYEESPFLEECIQSLVKQTVGSELIMVTSTLNGYICGLADKYEIPLRINTGDKGIVQDWNFAYKQADTKYATIAHQDDIYSKYYTEIMLKEMKQAEHPLIGFTDYAEIRQGKIVKNNTMLKIKRLMLLPLTVRYLQKSKFVRRRILSFGNPICCPSVTFCKDNLPDTVFLVGFRSDEDWQAWEKLSRRKGDYVYCSRILTYHRIHEESATTAIIGDQIRSKEDYEMFRRFWPECIAKFLAKFYSKSEKSNSLDMGNNK
ncbi:glycosyltransferase family 2 protein [Anaerocolumna sp. MB42-C2]|uniref:glycosyltransferase family 2 protein n=1 Tax=Anaerocolumna sp. MB42-C2 TaxID=3070997 RepID=UPI0027E03956|nr:glycosyltransferase family 2 protein [Anaerocolumna sp. MB42-C2]WMJ89685.1 glycosyltransferase family 2 protein [Anaerocolumna sp. MB42-C2]